MHSNIDHVCPLHSFWAGAAPEHWQTKKNFLNLGHMGLILTNSGAPNSNAKSELCYHVKVLRYRVSYNFMALVTATENNK